MRVKELIEELSKIPADYEVFYRCYDKDCESDTCAQTRQEIGYLTVEIFLRNSVETVKGVVLES